MAKLRKKLDDAEEAKLVLEFNSLSINDSNFRMVISSNQDKIDVFNNLPDEIISHILSFLPTKEAASTSVLSRRWRYLLASVPNLDFDDLFYNLQFEEMYRSREALDRWSMQATNFANFVERVLALHYDFTVVKFSLKITFCHDPVDPELAVSWIHKVLECGVSDLDLFTVCGWDWGLDFQLPSKLFMSETVVSLRITIVGDPANIINVEDFHLPKLKRLYLRNVVLDIGLLSKLLAGCKVLEELGLEAIGAHMWDSYSFPVTTLKRLTFRINRDVCHSLSSVSFDTPNLVNLEYTGATARKHLEMNFDSLVEAKIDLWLTKEQYRMAKSVGKASASELEALFMSSEAKDLFGDSTDLIKGICNVQSLYLSASTLEALTFCCKEIPIFRNLTHLAIRSVRTSGWESLPRLLKSCPNLETLVFRGIHHRCRDLCLCKEDDLTCLSTSPVKVVKILIGGKIENHIEEVKQFLETMPNLEQMILYYDDTYFDHPSVQVSNQLQSVASPKCKVQFIPSDLFLLPKWGRFY